MQVRVTVPPEGQTTIETVSMLEDLWHDYRYFKQRAESLVSDGGLEDGLKARRYCRAASVMFMFYVEGVLNRWLSKVLEANEWQRAERKSIERKMEMIAELVPVDERSLRALRNAKSLRNDLAHLKPGKDLDLWDSLTVDALRDAEEGISLWLDEVATDLGASRHPNTKEESRELRELLGLSGEGEHTDV